MQKKCDKKVARSNIGGTMMPVFRCNAIQPESDKGSYASTSTLIDVFWLEFFPK